MMNEFDRIKDFKAEERKRREFIELCIDKLYAKFPMVFTEPLEEVKEKALDKYMYTPEFYNLSYDEISKDLQAGIEARIEAARNTAKNNDYNVREDIGKFNETTSSINLINNEPTPSISLLNNDPTPSINLLNYDVPEISYKDNLAYIRGILLTPEQFAALKRKSNFIYEQDKGKDIFEKPSITEDIEKPQLEDLSPVSKGLEEHAAALNNMLAEGSSNYQTAKANANTDAVQYVKTANVPNNQSGNASLFNIVLTILGITSFVLVAMILNLLLK